MHLAFITPCVGEEVFSHIRRGAQDAADLHGITFDFLGTEDVDIEEQIAIVEKAIADRVDGIALSYPHETAFDEVTAKAIEASIPVIAFNIDSPHPDNPRLAGIAQDMREAGRRFGRRAAASIPEGAHVLFTEHSEGISALDDRIAGALETLADKRITHEIAITGMTAEGAADVIVARLERVPAITAVFATGMADTEGAGLAKQRFPERELFVAGFDVSDGILRLVRSGAIAFTVDQQLYAQGFYAVTQLALYLRKGVVPMDMNTGAVCIDIPHLQRKGEAI